MSSLLRRLVRPRPMRRPMGVSRDPFFADPGVVEDDYRRMSAFRNVR